MNKEQPDGLRAAFEADVQQYFVQSLTPDRGYDTPIDNLKTFFADQSARIAELERRVEELTGESEKYYQVANDACTLATEYGWEAEGSPVDDLRETLNQQNIEAAQLRAQVETLTRERDEARAKATTVTDNCISFLLRHCKHDGDFSELMSQGMGDCPICLRAQLAASEADRERLDWIENEAGRAWPFGNQLDVKFTCLAKEPFKERPTLRAAIDAARKEEA